jgi:creatinine amidohydrolase
MADVTWPEFAHHVRTGAVTIVPVGSVEQHGRHLPLGTDSTIATYLAERLAASIGGLVAPTFHYGFRSQVDTGGGEAFPGSTGIPGSTLSVLIADVLCSLIDGGCEKLIVLNAHYENAWFVIDGVEQALSTPEHTHARVLVSRWAPFVRPTTLSRIVPDGAVDWAREHAAIAETSLMLAIAPELVSAHNGSLVAPRASPYQAFPQPWSLPAHDGLLSVAEGATAELGEAMIRDVIEGLSAAAADHFGTGG